MSQFYECIIFEWGFLFIGLLVGAAFVVVGLVAFLFWLFGLYKLGSLRDEASYKDAKFKGPLVRVFGFLLIVGVIGYAIYVGYDKFSQSFAVAFDTGSSTGITLQSVRDKFQQDTDASINIEPSAKNFSIVGHYRGACAADLIQKICRQYSDKLACKTSWIKRSVTVELKQRQ